jgi:hypothetical protein
MEKCTDYIVRWLTGSFSEEYEVKQKSFNNETDANNYYTELGNSYPKKLIISDTVIASDDTETGFIPGGEDYKHVNVTYRIDIDQENEIFTYKIKYFDDKESAEEFFNTKVNFYPTSLTSKLDSQLLDI